MQPFDALTIRAVLQEAKPLIVNRKVDKIHQLGRDEVLLCMRSKSGMCNLFLSAQTAYGRLCLVKWPSLPGQNEKVSDRQARYTQGHSGHNQSNFSLLLKRHLTGATLVAVEQPLGERMVDFVFSCTDEVGGVSLKVLTAEIMGRHSNLIFWDKAKQKIIAASHVVTREMSRQREVAPGLQFERPPGQEKISIFEVSQSQFEEHLEKLKDQLIHQVRTGRASNDHETMSPAAPAAATAPLPPVTIEQWLISTYTGIGRHLSEELVEAAGIDSVLARVPLALSSGQGSGNNQTEKPTGDTAENSGGNAAEPSADPSAEPSAVNLAESPGEGLAKELSENRSEDWSESSAEGLAERLKKSLWPRILDLQSAQSFKPAMRTDLSKYTVLSLNPHSSSSPDWKTFPAVNDMIEEYYRAVETREQFQQLRERMRSELKGETEKLESRLAQASQHMTGTSSLQDLKRQGDLVLANIQQIKPGQEDITCQDYQGENGSTVTIKLNPNLTPSQNAQVFYRQYAKTRSRQTAASAALNEASNRLETLRAQMHAVDQATDAEELRRLKETVIGRRAHELPKTSAPAKKKQKSRILSMTSSDGWTIYVGRNRHENDHLLNRMAQPNDLWLHILGQGGAHVLIKVPSSKQEPPLNTIKEAAQAAARLSKAAPGTKVRVVYTQCKHVRKIASDKPGLVRYENEKTVEVDTAQPMPRCMQQLFSS